MQPIQGRHEIIHTINEGIEYPFAAFEQVVQKTGLIVDAHYHTFIEILYCLDGRYAIVMDGNEHEFSEGDMVVINSEEVHHVCSLDQGMNRYIVIQFSPELLYTTAQTVFEAKYVLPFTMKSAVHQRVFTKKELAETAVPRLLKQILSENKKKSYGFELAIRTNLGEVFLWILRSWHNKGMDLNLGSGLNQETMERLVKIFNYIDDHYNEPITLQEVADHCGMSYSYCSRFFKKSMGRNFSNYVNQIRVTKAEHLLATSDNSVTDVAVEVGFATTSYFIEQFKSMKGITPKQFRSRFLRTVTTTP